MSWRMGKGCKMLFFGYSYCMYELIVGMVINLYKMCLRLKFLVKFLVQMIYGGGGRIFQVFFFIEKLLVFDSC